MVRAVAVSILCFALILLAPRLVSAEGDRLAPVEDLADGGIVHIAAITDDGSLATDNGDIVRLAGLRIPKEDSWRGAAVTALRRLVEGHDVRLRLDVRQRDRYGRILAQVIGDKGAWLQGELLARGLAEVESLPGTSSLTGPMLALEAKARAQTIGLWSDRRFAVLSAGDIAGDTGPHLNRFWIVEGVVASVADRANWTFVNFGADWHADFTVAIAARNRRAVRDGGFDLAALTGKRIRVRGWIRDWNGPLIEVDHAGQIEILADPVTLAGLSDP